MESTVSVIIPVYNGQKTIKQTIDSVLNQTFPLTEVIIINDGSTDGTLAIVQNISDSRLKVFSFTNSGLSTSRNRGLSYASGKYISFIDADDIWTPDKIELQFNALQGNIQASVAYSWTDYINADGKFVKSGRHPTANGDIYHKLLIYNILENGSNPLIRREALTTVGNFDESLTAAEDWDMWLRLASQYEFVVVPQVQILYRVSIDSMSTNLKRQESASLKVIERAFTHPKAESLQHLKTSSLAQIYQYLTFKALDTSPQKDTSWIAMQFFVKCVRYNPSFLRYIRLVLITIFKIIHIQARYYWITYGNRSH